MKRREQYFHLLIYRSGYGRSSSSGAADQVDSPGAVEDWGMVPVQLLAWVNQNYQPDNVHPVSGFHAGYLDYPYMSAKVKSFRIGFFRAYHLFSPASRVAPTRLHSLSLKLRKYPED